MTSAEEFASRLREADTLMGGCRRALAAGSAELELTTSQLAAVFHGSSNVTAEMIVVSIEEAREKVTAATTLITSAADDLHSYLAQVLGGTPREAAAPSSAATHDDQETLTEPSRSPDPDAAPAGDPEAAPRASADVQESLKFQERTASALARAGYRVRRLPRTAHGVNPDFEIEGRIFDCYSPARGTTVDSVVTRVRKKSKRQASRFVVNLDRGGLDTGDLRARLLTSRPSRVQEVLVVENETVSRVWP